MCRRLHKSWLGVWPKKVSPQKCPATVRFRKFVCKFFQNQIIVIFILDLARVDWNFKGFYGILIQQPTHCMKQAILRDTQIDLGAIGFYLEKTAADRPHLLDQPAVSLLPTTASLQQHGRCLGNQEFWDCVIFHGNLNLRVPPPKPTPSLELRPSYGLVG